MQPCRTIMRWYDPMMMTARTVPPQIHHHAEECETDADWKTADDSSDHITASLAVPTTNLLFVWEINIFFWKGRAGSPGNSWNEQVLGFSLLLALLLFVWAAHFFSVSGRPRFTETENHRIPFYSHWWLTFNVTLYNSGLIVWNSCNAFIHLNVTFYAKCPIFF